MQKLTVGVDIGGTNTVIGVFDENLSLIRKSAIATTKPHFPNPTNSPDSFLNALAEEITSLVQSVEPEGQLTAVGMGVPGQVDASRGVVVGASNLAWYDVPIAEQMSVRLGVPVTIDNDVRMYTLGEAKAGAARGFRNFLCLTLGTGIAAGIVIDGNIVRGSNWYAGEIGHDAVEGEQAPCNCGQLGCLETIASATGIARLAKEAVERGEPTSLRTLDGLPSARDVHEACLNGDRVALDIYKFVGRMLGKKLTTAVYMLNPEAIILGGGVAAAGSFLFDPVTETIAKHYRQTIKPKVVAAELGDLAGIIGSAHVAREMIHT